MDLLEFRCVVGLAKREHQLCRRCSLTWKRETSSMDFRSVGYDDNLFLGCCYLYIKEKAIIISFEFFYLCDLISVQSAYNLIYSDYL